MPLREAIKMTAAPGSKVYHVVGILLGLLCISQAILNICLRLAGNASEADDEARNLTEHTANLTRQLGDCENRILEYEARLKSLIAEWAELQKSRDLIVEHYVSKGWTYFGNSVYYVSSVRASWNKSREYCLKNTADLMIINSAEEQNFTTTLKDNMWIGLTDREKKGTWKWVDETPLGQSYWMPNEPNNVDNMEDCVEVSNHTMGRNWNDLWCQNENYWVCERTFPV